MIDDLRAIAIFVEAVRFGSFKRASEKLNLSPSVVSYHISQLEDRVGNALLYRSTRKLSLTSEGQVLFEYAEKMLAAAEQGVNLVSAKRESPVGSLQITVPTSLTRGPLADKLASFKHAYADIGLCINYTDKRQDLIKSGIDLAIRVGVLPDSQLKSRHIGVMCRTLVCAPEYYKGQPEPVEPSGLATWDWIRHSMLPCCRTLIKGEEQVQVEFQSNVSVNSVDAMAQLSRCGLGLSTPPTLFVKQALAAGDLVEVLPDWTVESIPIYAVWPNNVSTASNTRLLLDHLIGV